MGTPSATPSGHGGWVRGPKTDRPAAPPPRPTPDGETTGAAVRTAVPHTSPAPASPARATAPVETVGRAAAQWTAPPQTAPPRTPQPAPRPRPRRQSSAPAAEPGWGEPRRPRSARGRARNEVGWVKAHGGAGVSSLVEVLGGVDVGSRWPDPSRGEPRRVVLVGRTSARGLQSVSQALGALKDGRAPQGIDLLAVVLVADAPGRLPLALLRRIRVLRSVARVQRVPWIPAWRTGGTPKVLPRQLDSLAELTGSGVHSEEAVS